MKTRKTIKWIASILGASILVSTAAFTVVSCSSSEPASSKYTEHEQMIMNYRKTFLKKHYDNLVKTTNKNYGGWKKEYDDLLQYAYNPYWNNLDVYDWYQDWVPYVKGSYYNGYLISMDKLSVSRSTDGYVVSAFNARIYSFENGQELVAMNDVNEKIIVEYQ